MAGSGRYTIQLDALVNDAKIRAQIAAIQKQINGGAFVAAGGKNGKGGATMIQQTTKSAQKANKELGKMNKALVGTQKVGRGAGLGLLDVTKKVAAFGAVTTVIQGATAGIGDMVKNVFELDAALTEYKKVSDLGQKGIEKMTDSAFKMGRTVAKTGTEMVQAATEFRKSGYSDKDAMKLGRIAMMYTNIADEELSAGDAANFIVSQMKAFGLEASQAEHIVDAVNEVSNNFAVSSADIATNIGKASAALATGNVTYEQSIGLTK